MGTKLSEFAHPYLRVMRGSAEDLANLLAKLRRETGADVRLVRAPKMGSGPQLFDEMAAAMQFPWYFGDNWDAFDECINDLEWISARHIIVGVTDASRLLADDSNEARRALAVIITEAATRHAERGARSLHFVFQVPDQEGSQVLTDWLGPLTSA